MTTEFHFSVVSDAKSIALEPVTRPHRSGQKCRTWGILLERRQER